MGAVQVCLKQHSAAQRGASSARWCTRLAACVSDGAGCWLLAALRRAVCRNAHADSWLGSTRSPVPAAGDTQAELTSHYKAARAAGK